MSASVISRATWTDDDGTGTTGTIVNNARLQADVYDKVDAIFASGTFTVGGLVAAEGFGTHLFSAGGTGAQTVAVRNTTAGTGNSGALTIGNNSTATLGTVSAYSSTFTPATYALASGVAIAASGAGGLSLATSNASGALRLYANSVEYVRLWPSGGLSIFNTTDPGAGITTLTGALNVTGTAEVFHASAPTLRVQHTSSGVSNTAEISIGNDVEQRLLLFNAYSSTWVTANYALQNGTSIYTAAAGGLSIVSTGNIRFYGDAGAGIIEQFRMLSSGQFAINTTAGTGPAWLGIDADAGPGEFGMSIKNTSVTNTLNYAVFYNSSSAVAGSIAQTGATTVAYNTTSDARLKIDGGTTKDLTALRALVIHDFTWASDGKKDRGVFAQEAISVFPRAITPGHDQMTLDGKSPVRPWMANYQAFIPDLIAGWQDHDATITDLLARVAKLEKV